MNSKVEGVACYLIVQNVFLVTFFQGCWYSVSFSRKVSILKGICSNLLIARYSSLFEDNRITREMLADLNKVCH